MQYHQLPLLITYFTSFLLLLVLVAAIQKVYQPKLCVYLCHSNPNYMASPP